MRKLRLVRATASALLLMLTLAALDGCAGLGGKCDDPACAQDADITARVKQAVFADRAMRAPNQITVATRDGVVYLSGQVATDLQKDQAESYARSVKGVEDVVNSLSVENNSR
jgi:osmotically-inducible protein OsmY